MGALAMATSCTATPASRLAMVASSAIKKVQ
jgi:hypothetical protein